MYLVYGKCSSITNIHSQILKTKRGILPPYGEKQRFHLKKSPLTPLYLISPLQAPLLLVHAFCSINLRYHLKGEIMKYTSVLIQDHESLRTLMDQMKSVRLDDEKREAALTDFIDLLESHTKAEEETLYKVRKENEWLKGDILEGLQEHRAGEELIEKIKRTTNRELRDAKIKVLCDYTQHHLDEEEEKLFPHFEKTISENQSVDLQVEYIKIRGETQKHLTADSHGALKI